MLFLLDESFSLLFSSLLFSSFGINLEFSFNKGGLFSLSSSLSSSLMSSLVISLKSKFLKVLFEYWELLKFELFKFNKVLFWLLLSIPFKFIELSLFSERNVNFLFTLLILLLLLFKNDELLVNLSFALLFRIEFK